MSLPPLQFTEYTLPASTVESEHIGSRVGENRVLFRLLLLAAHLAALAAITQVARNQAGSGHSHAAAAMLAAALAILATWGTMRAVPSTAGAALLIVAGCTALAAALPGPRLPRLLMLTTAAACAAVTMPGPTGRKRCMAANASPKANVPVGAFAAARRFQFSLRTMLATMTVAALAAAAYRQGWPVLQGCPTPQGGTVMQEAVVSGILAGIAGGGAILAVSAAMPSNMAAPRDAPRNSRQTIRAARRISTAAGAIAVTAGASWLYAHLGLGAAWFIAGMAALVALSLWLAAALRHGEHLAADAEL